MKMNKKLGVLSIASALCLAVGAVCINTTVANADESVDTATMTMLSGAAVNKTTDYGGIRWTTTIDQGFALGTETNLSFGTFVMPTATYNAEKATKDVNEMTGVMNLQYQKGAKQDTTNFDKDGLTFYSAISYDTIVADYKVAYPNTQKSDEEIAKEAYKLELTAVSYAYDGTNYVFVEDVDVSRSARQVANMAVLDGELENVEEQSQKDKINSYVGTRFADGTTSSGYLDLTEIKNDTAQTITSNLTALNQNWASVEEIVVNAKRIDKNVDDALNTISVNDVPSNIKTYEDGKFTYISAFTADGVYTLPVMTADVLISSWADVVDKLGNETQSGVKKMQSGYYLLTQDIEAVAEGTYTKEIVRENQSGNDKTEGLCNATLDGQGYKIFGFTTSYGLFGYVRNSTIKNLGIEGGIKAATGSSVVAMNLYDSKLNNVYVKMTVAGDTKGYSPVAYRMKNVSLKNCLIDSTVKSAADHYLPYYGNHHLEAPCSVSQGREYEGVTYDNSYVLSGLPLVYDSRASSVSATSTEATGSKTLRYVTTARMFDTLAETDIKGDKSVSLTGTEITGHTGANYQITVRGAEDADGNTVLSLRASNKTYSAKVPTKDLNVTKPIYYTGHTTSNAPHNRYYYYKTYTQVTGVKRYENATLMGNEAETNEESLNTFNSNYWTISNGNLMFGRN